MLTFANSIAVFNANWSFVLIILLTSLLSTSIAEVKGKHNRKNPLNQEGERYKNECIRNRQKKK